VLLAWFSGTDRSRFSGALRQVVTKPKKTGITVHLVALAWRAD